MMLVIRLAAAVATLGLLSSIPAAGQAKLSTQQLNSPTLNANKPIAAPKVYSPNLTKPITAAPVTVQRPVPDNNPRPMAHGSIASGTITYRPPNIDKNGGNPYPGAPPYANANKTSKLPPAAPAPDPLAGYASPPSGQCAYGC
jgi:hypothetical protein